MKLLKKSLLAATLTATVALPIAGCSSTTDGGTVGADRRQLLLVSSSEVMQLSNQAYQQTIAHARAQGKLDTNAAQVARLRRIANDLIPQTAVYRPDATRWQWQVHAISSNDINAYVMPGGKIVFYSGIIDRLNLTDAEIAAIMGHEMAHALREHSRSQESEADRIGLEIMARAGFDPQAAVSLWQKMQAMEASSQDLRIGFLSTHPTSTNRIKELQALQSSVRPLYLDALTKSN